jgi:hypothetical protein
MLKRLRLFSEILHFNPDPGLSFPHLETTLFKAGMFQGGLHIIGESESLPGYFAQFVIHLVIPVHIIQYTDDIGPRQNIIKDYLHHSFLEGGLIKIISPGRIDRKLFRMGIQAQAYPSLLKPDIGDLNSQGCRLAPNQNRYKAKGS